jgi:cytochrome c peroxidase
MLGWLLAFWAGALTPPLGLDTYVPAPERNPITEAKARLGRELFQDPILSRDGSVSCASCHERERAFTDRHPLAVGIGQRKGSRRTPSIINRAFGKAFFWDGRTKTLEEQVLEPIRNPNEMDLAVEEALERLRQPHYAAKFQRVFGRPVNAEDLAFALATYVRTILSGESPYDRYVAGDRGALSAEAQAGLKLFRGKAGCVACHVGANFTDERLHNTGAGASDIERRFKTPTLREVAVRAPYMHDGSMATLEEVIDFYDRGGKANPNLDPDIQELHLSASEKRALIEFLRSLSGRVVEGFSGN